MEWRTIKNLFVAALFLAVSGCSISTQLQAGAARAAELEDQALLTATWTMCRAISVGAWLRAYSNDPLKAQAWRTLCKGEIVQELPAQQ